MGARPLAAAERAEPTRAPRARRSPAAEPRLRVFRKCACGGGASCKCGEQAQASPDRETVAMLARFAGNSAVAGLVQRDESTAKTPKPPKLDEKAQKIVDAAKDTTVDESKRAVAVVQAIVSTYFAGDGAMVDSVVWDSGQKGLHTQSVGSGDKAKGKISVGRYFLQHSDETGFARRVIQVDHELEHVRQYRAGITGSDKSDEREFLAFQREALEAALDGTGRIAHSTRVDLIDGALGYYNCLADAKKTAYKDKQDALLKEREQHNGKGGHPKTEPPTECKRVE